MSKVITKKYSDRVEYTLDGLFHREDGPAIEWYTGDKFWHLYGELHRENGPAIEFSDGEKCWFIKGMRHRENGPARELPNGDKQYWLNDKYLDFITNDQMLIYYLKYGFLK